MCERRPTLESRQRRDAPKAQTVSNGRHMTKVPSVLSTHPLDSMISTVEEILGPTEIQQPRNSWDCTFLRPVDPLPFDTYQFLDRKGAFRIPIAPVRGEILVAYIKWVHPLCPLFDLAEFLDDVVKSREGRFPSPLLYQAVLFAGSAFVDSCIVQEGGYTSRREMRKSLFEKTKWLYILDTESDAVRQIQALLLMTHWHEVEDDSHKDPDYWLSLAHGKAQAAGLYPPFDRHQHLSIKFQRRLWSCLYLRDRLISLGVRRPPRIQDSPAPIIEIEDLNIEAYSSDIQDALPYSTARFLTPEFQAHSNLLYIEKIKLAACVGEILDGLFQLSLTHHPNDHSPSLTLIPAQPSPAPAIQKCSFLLQSWFESLPGAARFYPPFPDLPHDSDSASTVLLIHQADIYLLYLAAMAAFYLCLRSAVHAETRLRNIASEITKTISELRSARLQLYLPGTSITVLLFATATHLLDLASASGAAYSSSLLLLKECAESAEELGEIYPRASLVVSFTSAGLEKYSRNTAMSGRSHRI
ncbi:hypothetical protein MW887_006834 [Aspergillus wentii]|nr:hypothetical protein MW887_006834 [Aspergillus wentii]